MFNPEDWEKFSEEYESTKKQLTPVASLLPLEDAMQYQEQQTAADKALEVGENVLKSLYNGSVVQYGGGAVNFLRGLHDVNVEQLNRDYPERMQGDSTLLEDIANSSVFQPYEVKADTAAGEYAYNLVQGAGQLAVQIPASMALGPVGAGALMGMTIAGQDYKELREQGVDPETSLKAGAIDAAIQAPLESIGLGAITKSFPANTLLKQQVRSVILRGLEEGVTEWAEQYPDEITKIWALNKDKSMDEILQLVIDALPSITKHGIYAGSIGWALGGGVSGVNLAIDRVTGRHIEHAMERAAQREAYTARMEQEESRINRIKESGENPARAAVIINDNMQNETVYVDGETLQGYAQEKGIEKVAESLGVTVEDIEKAAADGDTVDVKIGNFEATGAAFDGFMDAVKDDTAFEDGGYTPNQDKLEQEWAKKYQAQEQAINTEEDRLFNEMREAGVNKQTATEGLALLHARAVMTDDPAEFLKKLSFQAGGDAGNGYQQFAGEHAKGANEAALQKALSMVWSGKTPEEIFKETGWVRGKDGKWRFEIPDDVNKIDFAKVKTKRGVSSLEKVYDNRALFEAYPFLKKVRVVATEYENDAYHGMARGRTIEISKKDLAEDEDEACYTLVHEIQHLIQNREGFAIGGTAEDAREFLGNRIKNDPKLSKLSDNELYWNLAGEQEASYTEDRADIRLQLDQALEDKADAEEKLAEALKNKDEKAEDDARKALFVATMQERQARNKLEKMPMPHDENAIVIFGDSAVGKVSASTPQQSLEAFLQAAWHGSPHKFVKFDLGAIGTGEGAQAHGWGLYFAQDKEVSQRYRDELTRAAQAEQYEKVENLKFKGKTLQQWYESIQNDMDRADPRSKEYEVLRDKYYMMEQTILHVHPDSVIEEAKEDELNKNAIAWYEKTIAKNYPEPETPGSLFQVEIPDDDVLLDENKTLAQQPKKVREAIRRFRKNYENRYHYKKSGNEFILYDGENEVSRYDDEDSVEFAVEENNMVCREDTAREFGSKKDMEKKTGRELYLSFSNLLHDQKAASEALNDIGIKGIAYDGRADGRCFVVFDDAAINIIDTYNQQVNSGEAETKGEYNPNTNIITLFNGADASTVIHETWHFFVEQMWNSVQDGTASAQTIKDFDTLLGYAGMTRDEWANADVDGRRAAHERLAEAGETYIMEGKSPSFELRRVFQKFAEWLKSVYRTLQRSENAAELTDEVREVFDRMLAAEDDIAHMERVNGYFAKLPDVITDNMSEATKMRVENFIDNAREKAVEMLTRRALKNYTKERREEVKKFKEEIRPSVEDEISKRRVYACGYDKNDAERFQKLQKQKAEFGIYTDENFIDRSFPAETDEAQNEVAHLAAVVNPKNWTKGLAEVKKDFQRQADEILQPALDALESGTGQGVDILRETNEQGKAKGDIVGRVSNNAEWYRAFYAENKRKPTKAELREMAKQLISGDVNAPKVEGWIPTTAEEAEAMRAEGERLASIERRIEACDEIKEKLKTVEEGYKSTSAAGSEDFMFQAQITAERFGYSSADEMMKDIEASPTKEQAVKQRINERVEELSGENEKENYASAIREALYNEDEALLIGVEQQLIEDYAAKAKERQEAQDQKTAERKEQAKISAEIAAARKQQAKNAAQADLAKMTVKEATRTNKFITAERRAAAKCAELLAKKKFDEALTQKNLQAYWHAMAAESIKIAKRQKQYEKFLKTQVKLKPEAWLNETNFAAVSQLFSRMGIARPVHMEAAGNTEYPSLAAYADAMEQLYDCVDIAPWILDESIPLSDTNALTLEQYEDVVNAVKNIKAIVKAQKGVDTFNRQETWANTKALMMEKLSALKTIWTPNPNKPTKASQKERFIDSMENLDTFLEFMDNATYGFFSKTFGNAIKHASDKEYEYREQYDKADAEALKKWLPDAAAESASNEEVYYDELGNSVTKHTLVKMLINLGNKENAQRLCETVPVGFERSTLWIMPDEITDRQTAAEATRQNLVDFFGRVLTKEDVEYAQRKIDAAEMFWGEKNELEKRVKGFGLKKVEATPVELMINGEPVVLRGGYFPLMRNGETGSHAATAEVQDDDPLQGKRIRTYHTNTSATKARTQARYPVNLFPGAETQWIYESIHDLCWRETMNDFRRVLNDQELFATMKSKIGVARMQVFKEMLEVCADPRNSKSFSEGESMLGDGAAWLRQKTSHAVIMWNLKVIAQNYANALLYGNAIEGYTMADNLNALGMYFIKYHMPESHKEMVDFVFSKSVFMRERSAIPDITVRDIVNEKRELAWTKFFRETGIKAMAMTDNATAIPNWLTAYNKKLSEGALEQEAIDYADALVRRVLGSSRITDVASIQRGGEIMKLITMFQSFFNARFNEFLRMERLASKQWTEGQKMEAFANVCSYVLSKWLGQTMLAMALALQNPFGVDDEDKWPELIKELKSYSFSMLGPVGQIGNAIAGSFAGMHEYNYRMSAIESTVEKLRRVGTQLHSDKATTQDKVEGVVDTVSMYFDVPVQLNRIFWNGVDILLNGMDPEIGDIMRRRPKKERK